MGDDLTLPERNCARTPMQWSTEPHGGFTKSDKPVVPVISGGPYGYEHVNAAEQRRDPNSLLNWTERIIRMRKEVPEIGWGDFSVAATPRPGRAGDALRLAQQLGAVRAQSRRQAARDRVLGRAARATTGKLLVNLLTEDHSHADEQRQAPAGARGLRLPLVPRRRPGLSAEAQRHRRSRQRRSPGVIIGIGRLALVRLRLVEFGNIAMSIPGGAMITPSLPRRSSTPSTGSPLRSRKVDSRISLSKPIALEVTAAGSAPRFSATISAPSIAAPAIEQDVALRGDRLVGCRSRAAASLPQRDQRRVEAKDRASCRQRDWRRFRAAASWASGSHGCAVEKPALRSRPTASACGNRRGRRRAPARSSRRDRAPRSGAIGTWRMPISSP